MPKRLMMVLCVAALAVAACHSSSSTTPTPSFTPSSPAPNPSIRTAHVYVTVNGQPKPRIPVQESTPKSTSSPRPGNPFETLATNHNGKVKFPDLKPAKTYCWVAILPTGKSFECAGWEIWQTTIITLGT
ncbi:MAG: hypothetical protein WAK11_06015 [Candidatus Cybelea sp.]